MPAIAALGTVVQRVPHIVFSRLDDEWLAIDSESGYCYNLNEVAGRVWELIASPTALSSVCHTLYPHYTVDEATCQRDVLELSQQLLDYGLVTVVAPPA